MQVNLQVHVYDITRLSVIYSKCSKNLYSKILISKRKIPKSLWGK